MAKLWWSPWSDLPKDLLHVIFKKLENPPDIYQCGTVCVSWKSVATAIFPNSHFILLPNQDSGVGDCVLINTQTKGIHTITLSELDHVRVFSSSFDWLLTVRRKPPKVCLLNPITREQIKLPLSNIYIPPQKKKLPNQIFFRNFFERSNDFRVIITSTSLLDPECIVIVQGLHDCPSSKFSIIYCRPGVDSYWKAIEIDNKFNDLIFHKGRLYSVDECGKLYSIALFRRSFGHLVVGSYIPRLESGIPNIHYLVEVEGDLLLVTRSGYLNTFMVYKLDWIEEKWIKVRSIGNYAILLGRVYRRCSVSIPINCSRDFFKADCIYFQDQYNINLFDIATGYTEQVYDLMSC